MADTQPSPGEHGRLPECRLGLPTSGPRLECVVQRKVFSPNDFHTLDEVESRLLDFQQYYEQIATPFEWKFTKDDLNALLKRIADHENTTLTPAA
jgi:hypothetical protein